jgi:hypothetical protein
MTGVFRFGSRGLAGTVAILLALLGAAGVAEASPRAQVRSELRQAGDALKLVWQQSGDSAAEDGDDAAEIDDPGDVDESEPDPGDDEVDAADGGDDSVLVDLDAMAANLAHTQRARALASKLKRPARARALAAVGRQADENLFEYADDVAWVPASLQPDFVAALEASSELRSATIEATLKRAQTLPKRSRAKLLRSLTDALTDGDPELLLELLADEEDVVAPTKTALAGSLRAMLDQTDAVRASLRRLSGEVSRRDRGDVRAAITAIDLALADLPGSIDALLTEIADYDDPAAAATSFCALVASVSLPIPAACG